MAPEQATDAMNVLDRADVYALGVVLFEMIAGRPPFLGSNARAILVAQVLHAPPSLGSAAPSVPEALSVLVYSCLAKTPGDRPSAAKVCDELSGIEASLADDRQGPAAAARTALDPLLASTLDEDDGSSSGRP